ncbi:PPOX class F420-dependent oxidoreductase [uncultured Jatrophihabitans sp.]|uniref:PPOX class F420-dependent oxidoreductase n=1 Tax=uncultured Jatrophihabitans sp. TaxID=1610747 RepID=UPI0035CAD7B8
MDISDEKYLSLTTYRKDGKPVSLPVWVVPLEGGRLGFWTSSTSVKVKRMRNNSAVTLQPCDARGRVKDGAAEVTGTAALVTSGDEFDAIQRKVRAKYGVMVRVSRVLNTLGHIGKGRAPYGDLGVVITPAAAVH